MTIDIILQAAPVIPVLVLDGSIDPAALADEAASRGLFGGRRWISVTIFSGGGDELVVAAENLLYAARDEGVITLA